MSTNEIYWDEQLQMNTQRKYAEDEPARLAPGQRVAEEAQVAGEMLNDMAMQLMRDHPGTTYTDALHRVMDANPSLKATYSGNK